MRTRKAEVDKIVRLLDAEYPDVEELGKAVLSEALDLFLARDWWLTAMHDAKLGTFLFGPYESESAAMKAIGKQIVQPGPEQSQFRVVKFIRPDFGTAREGA
jgi:hypothetical protein